MFIEIQALTPHLQRLSLVPMAAPTTSKAKIPKCYISVSLPCTMAGETTFSLGSQKANFQVTKVLFSIYHLDKACSSFCFSIWKQDNPTSSGIRSSISPAGEISWTLSYLLFSTCPNPIIIISASSAFKTPSPVYLHEDGLPLFRVSHLSVGFPDGSVVKNLPANAVASAAMGSIPGSGRSSGGGHGNSLQYSCLENPTDRGAWWSKGLQRVRHD